jgi:hypothetical protein
MSLAVGDFFVSFLACPFGFSSAIARKWIWGHSGCIWYAFITTLVGLASIVQLAILAIERFVTLRSRGAHSKKFGGVSYVLGPTFVVFVFGKKTNYFKAHRR